jgi:hypothetical protein
MEHASLHAILDRARRELCEHWIPIAEVIGKQHGFAIGIGLDDAAADEEPNQPANGQAFLI